MKAHRQSMAVCAILALSATSCNLFSPFDNPTSDPQLISAARACLDNGDYECAKEHYQKLSPASSDIANSEMAFTILNENGAGMAQFAAAFGSGETASGLNSFAASLASGSGQTRRLAIYEAYKIANTTGAIQDPTLKAFVKFVSSTALAAEILAESVGDDNILSKTDISSDGASCVQATCGATCGAPSNGKLVTGADVDLDVADATASLTGTTTLGMLNGALDKANSNLSAMGVGGDFGQTEDSFGAITGGAQLSTNPCYRYLLIDQGIGE